MSERGRPWRDETEALQLPPVPAERLDAVLHAAGPRLLPALAVLCCAIGFLVAKAASIPHRPLLLRGLAGAIDQAVRLHHESGGRG